ncbi:MAG: hypothetical protein P8X96_16620 [Desulfobacteraceae bacterium]
MKKLLVIFIVLAFVAPAMAADNLSISGGVRVRTWDRENYSDFDDAGNDKSEYVDQRFRIQLNAKANDNVKGVLQVDFAELDWGSSTWTGYRPGNTATNNLGDANNSHDVLEVNRAYMDVNAGPVNILGGLFFTSVGQGQVIRNNKPGVQLTIKTPVIIELGYTVEGDEDRGATNDEQNIHASVAYKSDKFSVEGFYGQQMTSWTATDNEDTRTVYGVNFKTMVGPVSLNSELAFFGGDNEQTSVDYVGTQFNVDADMKINNLIKVGVDGIYSSGTDDATEDKIAYIGDVYGRLNRSEGGSGNNVFAGDLAPLGPFDVFDPFNNDQGALGIGVDAVVTPVAGLKIIGHIMYLTAAEDAPTGSSGYPNYDDAMVYNIGASYEFAPKAKVALFYNLVDADFEGTGVADDNASNIGGTLTISF